MNRLLALRDELGPDGRFRLADGDPRATHLDEVLKPAAGARLRAGVVGGRRGEAEVIGRDGEGWSLRFRALEEAEAPGPWTLLLALPRPQTLRKVLLAAPQLGVGELLLVGAARTEKSYFHSPLLSEGEWRRQLRAGMEQAGTVRQPRVLVFRRLHELLALGLERWLPADAPRLLPHPGGGDGLESLLGGAPVERAALAVGPEGGWQEGERRALEGLGFRPVDLGERILRVETAVDWLCAQLDLLARVARTRNRTA